MKRHPFSPKTIAKAARLVVAARPDGTYDVAGDTGTYRVRILGPDRMTCDCFAGRCGSHCSHVLAVRLHRDGPSTLHSLTSLERVSA